MNPPNEPTGTGLGAAWLRALRRFCISERLLPGVGYRKKSGVDGYTLEFPTSSTATSLHPFKIIKVSDFQYCVRGGFVGVRPRNALPDANNMNFNRSVSEYRLEIRKGTDQAAYGYKVIPGYTASDFYKSAPPPKAGASGVETVTVGNTGDFGASSDTTAVIFKLNELQDSSISDPAAAFFIDMTDDGILPDGVHGEIKCRMVTTEGSSGLGRTNTMFPDDCIPIGLVIPSGGNWGFSIAATPAPLEVEQLLCDHYLYRVPHFNNGNPFGNYTVQMPLWWLGEWSDDTNDDFSGKVYYPGDVVTTPTTVSTGYDLSSDPIELDYNQMWMKVAPAAVCSNSPESSPSGWQLISGFPGA